MTDVHGYKVNALTDQTSKHRSHCFKQWI